MKRIKPFTLLIISILWIGYIFTGSLENVNHFSWEVIISDINAKNFVEKGLLPVIYVWMFYIFTKIFINGKFWK